MKKKQITILLPAGRLSLDLMEKCQEFAKKYELGVYLTTVQNLRLIDIPESAFDEISNELSDLGAKFKAPGVFPIPRVCVGKPHCELAIVDTEKISANILQHFAERSFTKPKIKIAISACPAGCSGAKTSDIGIISTRKGFNIFAGGKGGSQPTVGKRILKNCSEEEIVSTIQTLLDFHDRKTKKKQRLAKLMDDPDFPYQV
jgi:dissimilatory sulfite reductase (desulfoviridin) alpha/beta subunit